MAIGFVFLVIAFTILGLFGLGTAGIPYGLYTLLMEFTGAADGFCWSCKSK